MNGGLLGLGADYRGQAGQAMGTSANLQQQRRMNNRAMGAEEQQSRIGLVTSGAGTGAAIGSAVPGVGTSLGAGLGAGLGLLASFF